MRISTPAGSFHAPKHEADRVQAMDDAELLAAVKVDGMVDPFALTEAVTRGIWRDERPARAGGIAHQMQRMGA